MGRAGSDSVQVPWGRSSSGALGQVWLIVLVKSFNLAVFEVFRIDLVAHAEAASGIEKRDLQTLVLLAVSWMKESACATWPTAA
ncbi:MAG: hypothetical protein EA377_12980 [Phycisphaerales bacterium]|nr:MAG: hypothetical protein EA377_12980 [Phycisphaerales bacterium]